MNNLILKFTRDPGRLLTARRGLGRRASKCFKGDAVVVVGLSFNSVKTRSCPDFKNISQHLILLMVLEDITT